MGAAAAAAFPIAEGLGMAAGVATGGAAALAGGAAYGLYQGGRWLLSGNGGDAASSSGGEFQDLRTLNGVQQGTPQERFSVQQPRVQQPMVSRLNSSDGSAAGAAATAGAGSPCAAAEDAFRAESDLADQQRQRQLRPCSETAPAAGRAVLQRAAAGGAGPRAGGGVIC